MTPWQWGDLAFIAIFLVILVIMSNKALNLVGRLATQLALPAEHQVKNSSYRGPYFNADKVELAKEKYESHLKWVRFVFIVLLINIGTFVHDIITHR